MRLSRASLTSLVCTSFLMLSLSYSGVALSAAEVESRSESSSGWRPSRASEQHNNLELMKKIEFLQQEVQELRGKVEEQTYQLQQLQEQQKKLYLDLDRRMREGNSAAHNPATSGISYENDDPNTATKAVSSEVAPSSAAPTAGSNVSPTSPAAVSPVSSEDETKIEEKAYQSAYHLIQSRDHDGALAAFQKFVKDFPRGKYLPNAQYWLGEIYLTKGNIDLAAQAFNTVYRNYPQHPKAADSLLKLGYVEYAKGQWKRSQEILNQVKSQYPGSTSAQLADARLQKIQHEGH